MLLQNQKASTRESTPSSLSAATKHFMRRTPFLAVHGQPASLLDRREWDPSPNIHADHLRVSRDGKPSCLHQIPKDARCAVCLEGDSRDNKLLLLDCSHCYHLDCIKAQLASGKKQQSGERITHGHLQCGLCRADIRVTVAGEELLARDAQTGQRLIAAAKLNSLSRPMLELREHCLGVCRERARVDGSIAGLENLDASEANDRIAHEMACYRCRACAEVFCGGMVECAAAASGEGDDNGTAGDGAPFCQKCAWKRVGGSNKCDEHGPSKAIYKCDCCCAVATFDCGGNHYCDTCHATPNDRRTIRPQCRGRPGDACPLGILHPPNQPRDNGVAKNGFVLGCVVCLGIDAHCVMGAVSSSTRARWAKS